MTEPDRSPPPNAHSGDDRPQWQQRCRELQRLLQLCLRERSLDSHDLHDGPVQLMAASVMLLEAAAAHVDSNADLTQSLVSQAAERIRAAMQEARDIIRKRRHPTLEADGLPGAIQELVAAHRATGLHITLDMSLKGDRFLPSLEAAIYQIARESLNNVSTHSGAQRAQLSLREKGELIELRVEDQGCGFDVASVPNSRLGLWGIRERAALLGGTATIESRPGHGTRLHVQVPTYDPLLLE